MSVDDPVASLALADTVSRRLAGRARWVREHHLLQAACWLTATLFFGLVCLPTVGSRGGLTGMVVPLGLTRFPGSLTFWVSAALLVAVPSLVTAVIAGRATDPR